MSSSDERSPKRQRRSYSPASPPLPDVTGKFPAAAVVQPPQTPPPSVHMSPSWQSAQLPGLGTVGSATSSYSTTAGGTSSAGAATNSSFPTSPSTAGLNGQSMARMASNEGRTGESAQHTPTSEAEQLRLGGAGGLGEQVMSEAAQAADSTMMDVTMAEDDEEAGEEHRRIDHEREEGEEGDDTLPPLPGANVLYKLSVDPIAPARPLFSQNVIDLYNLQHIQSSVARKNAAGVKINKLRKSYEGKLNQFKLEGRNKSTKQEGWFTGFLHPGWDVQFEDGRTMWDVDKADFKPGATESDERILGLLDKALDLKPGHLPKKEHEEWRSLTGLDEPAGLVKATPVVPAAVSAFAKPPVAALGSASSSSPAMTAPSAAVANGQYAADSPKTFRNGAARPERQGKKRRYDERSYEGYNDGYEDDGYDTGGVDEAGRRGIGGKRQKRKVS